MERLLMISKSKIFSIAFLFIISIEGVSQKLNPSFSLNGYVKYLPAYMDYSFFESENNHLIHNRINFRGYFGDNLSIGLELRNRVFFNDIPSIQGDDGLVNMSYFIVREDNFVFNSMIDRLWLKYQKDKVEISIGRQRVNWGVNTIWNNNDLFNAYNFIDFDYIERPGSDVVRFIYTGDNLSSFELVYMPNERKGYALAGLYKLNSFGYDFQLLAANYFNDIVLGGGWAGNIKNAGFKGELSYFFDKENIENSLSFSSSLDYSTKNGFYFLGSYLYNSNGMNESNFLSLININANVLSPKNLMPSKHSYLLQVNKPISPPLNMSLNILYGKGIKLLYISPSLSYDISSNLDAGVIVQYFYLDNFGDFKNLLKGYYLQLKYSF
ncbi:MAG: hypothetical protein CMB86_04290 [Flammeovirgaceae bacterium]|nr:hypothetical protein [Flammeovirgaceae bacterium]